MSPAIVDLKFMAKSQLRPVGLTEKKRYISQRDSQLGVSKLTVLLTQVYPSIWGLSGVRIFPVYAYFKKALSQSE